MSWFSLFHAFVLGALVAIFLILLQHKESLREISDRPFCYKTQCSCQHQQP